LTENAAYAVGNAALTAHYVSGLGPKAVRIQELTRSIIIILILYF
jgi:hypothetical protein